MKSIILTSIFKKLKKSNRVENTQMSWHTVQVSIVSWNFGFSPYIHVYMYIIVMCVYIDVYSWMYAYMYVYEYWATK